MPIDKPSSNNAPSASPPGVVSYDSDQLGKIAENEFQQWCTLAGLFPQKCDWDRTGWDYVVEWPLATDKSETLDQRPQPYTCVAQVKGFLTGNESIEARLSSMERLAKDPRPTLVVALELSPSGRVLSAYACFVIDGLLRRILKKLREAQVGNQAPNQVTFAFSARRWGEHFRPDGRAFRELIERRVGRPISEFSKRKQQQLAELGYEQGRFSLKTTIPAKPDEIVDAFFGLRKLSATDVQLFDRRFGVLVPIKEHVRGPSELEIRTEPRGGCKIIVGPEDQPFGSFPGKIYTAPRLITGADSLVILVRTDLFRLQVSIRRTDNPNTNNVNLLFSPETDFFENNLTTVDQWLGQYRMGVELATGDVRIAIKPEKKFLPPIVGMMHGNVEHSPANDYWLDLLTRFGKLLEVAEASHARFALRELEAVAQAVEVMEAMAFAPETLNPLTFTSIVGDEPTPDSISLLVFNVLEMQGFAIVCVGRSEVTSTLTDDNIHWQGGTYQFLACEKIKSADRELTRLIKRTEKLSGVSSYFVTRTSATSESASVS